MPSPFPGMDPYLENPGLWPDVHHRLITIASDMLAAQLRPKYYVRIEERVYISDENDPGRGVIAPDLGIAERPSQAGASFEPTGVATLEVAEPVLLTTLFEEEINEGYLEVIDRDQRDVVTIIEIVSPSNKVAGSRGRQSFLQKREEVMHSPTNWVEIDLLRTGEPLRARELMAPCEYTVHVSAKGTRPKGWVWTIRLPQRLPAIHIPLRESDPNAKLDLQAVLTTAYERAGYDLEIDYTKEPNPPLSEQADAWMDALLREKNLR